MSRRYRNVPGWDLRRWELDQMARRGQKHLDDFTLREALSETGWAPAPSRIYEMTGHDSLASSCLTPIARDADFRTLARGRDPAPGPQATPGDTRGDRSKPA